MRQDFDMIQNFEVQGGPEYGQKNLPKLRKALDETGLDGVIVPHTDEYQNCLLYTSPSPRDGLLSRMPSSA